MKDYGTKTCPICGLKFEPHHPRQFICDNPVCKKTNRRAKLAVSGAKYRERKREYMRKMRHPEQPKTDTIVAIGYADRQRAETLKMVGGVNTEL